MEAATVRGTRRRPNLRVFWASLSASQKRTLFMMLAVIATLHVLGFVTVIGVVAPHHYNLGAKTGFFTIGLGVTAYTLGMRHAFDADHISAIDNVTRKLINDGQRPLSVGFWFSLGHSTIVFALAFALTIGIKALVGPVNNSGSTLHTVTNYVGTGVSGFFLYLIAGINLVILAGIVKVFRGMKSGRYDEAALEKQLDSRGFMNRFFGGRLKAITKPYQMYPVGVLFGLGFDTATEIAVLTFAGGAAAVGGVPWYAILCLPILFAAGMSLLDTIDGSFMNFAYGWAFSRPVRKVFYNLTITGLSVAVAFVIGTIEIVQLAASKLNWTGSFWTWFGNLSINYMGFAIVGTFVLTWIIALSVWHFGHVEEKWGAHVAEGGAGVEG